MSEKTLRLIACILVFASVTADLPQENKTANDTQSLHQQLAHHNNTSALVWQLHAIDECKNQPCRNGGTCLNLFLKFQCICQPGFTGETCQEVEAVCSDQVCRNGATCVSLGRHAICLCGKGFHGSACQNSDNPCSSGPCGERGKCHMSPVFSFRCECSGGYSGSQCHVRPAPNSVSRVTVSFRCSKDGREVPCPLDGALIDGATAWVNKLLKQLFLEIFLGSEMLNFRPSDGKMSVVCLFAGTVPDPQSLLQIFHNSARRPVVKSLQVDEIEVDQVQLNETKRVAADDHRGSSFSSGWNVAEANKWLLMICAIVTIVTIVVLVVLLLCLRGDRCCRMSQNRKLAAHQQQRSMRFDPVRMQVLPQEAAIETPPMSRPYGCGGYVRPDVGPRSGDWYWKADEI